MLLGGTVAGTFRTPEEWEKRKAYAISQMNK